MAMPTFLPKKLHANIAATSTVIEQWNCEW